MNESETSNEIPEKLRRCWHPVSYSETLEPEKPLPVKLLNELLVVWRTGDGSPQAMQDLCIHRGTALSLGHLVDDCIVCPYHGWRYDPSGACTLIPQTDSENIPSKARVVTYRCQERYGLIWVALEDPVYPLPHVPELEDDTWQVIHTGPHVWDCDASRQLENFTDFGHFPWVHPGLLGDIARPVVPDHTVEARGHVLHYSVVRPEATNSEEFPIFANEDESVPERRSRYEVHCPYTLALRLGWGGEKGMVYFFVSQPEAHDACRGYCIVARNYDFDEPESVIQRFEDTIFSQDKRVILSQRPEMVPFDLSDELHLKFDAVAVNYRRTMRKEGLA
jgi:phenylpropionate dioxygenase-like ring-hydroxylating dioxygenase large terminal subunit